MPCVHPLPVRKGVKGVRRGRPSPSDVRSHRPAAGKSWHPPPTGGGGPAMRAADAARAGTPARCRAGGPRRDTGASRPASGGRACAGPLPPSRSRTAGAGPSKTPAPGRPLPRRVGRGSRRSPRSSHRLQKVDHSFPHDARETHDPLPAGHRLGPVHHHAHPGDRPRFGSSRRIHGGRHSPRGSDKLAAFGDEIFAASRRKAHTLLEQRRRVGKHKQESINRSCSPGSSRTGTGFGAGASPFRAGTSLRWRGLGAQGQEDGGLVLAHRPPCERAGACRCDTVPSSPGSTSTVYGAVPWTRARSARSPVSGAARTNP